MAADEQSDASGPGTTLNFTNMSSAGPVTFVTVHCGHSFDRTLSSITFDGNPMTIPVQDVLGSEAHQGLVLCIITGVFANKTVSVTFSAVVSNRGISICSLSGLGDTTLVDTDSDIGAGP